MAQLVEQRIRNAWVAGSSPASGSLSWYPLDTSFFCVTESHPQGSCGPCIVCWQDGIDPYIISVLIRPRAPGTAFGQWTAAPAPGTRLGAWNSWTARRVLERAKRIWNAAQRHTLTLKCVNFVNFVNFWKEKSHRFRDGICSFNTYLCLRILSTFAEKTMRYFSQPTRMDL